MRQGPEMSPFTIVYESRAHEQHIEQNENTALLDQRQGLAAIFVRMRSRKGAGVFGQIASQRAALVVHQGWLVLFEGPIQEKAAGGRNNVSFSPLGGCAERCGAGVRR